MPPKLGIVDKGVYGVVRWFNIEKAIGRIHIEPHGEVFVHQSKVKSSIHKDGALHSKQRVRCDVLRGPKGLQATNVEVIQTAKGDKVGRRSSSKAPKERPSGPIEDDDYDSDGSGSVVSTVPNESSYDIVEKDLRGEVTCYNRERGSGFVQTRQYGTLPVQVSHVTFSGPRATETGLEATQIVKCDVGRDSKAQLAAINVHVITEAATTDAPQPGERAGKKRAQGAGSLARDNEEEEEEEPPGIVAEDQLGEVLDYKQKKKFGFLRVQGHGNVFVHKSGLMHAEELTKGQVVKCDITRGPKTLMALNVRVVADGNSNRPPPNATPPPQQQQSRPRPPYPGPPPQQNYPYPGPPPQQNYPYRGPPPQQNYPYRGPPPQQNYHPRPPPPQTSYPPYSRPPPQQNYPYPRASMPPYQNAYPGPPMPPPSHQSGHPSYPGPPMPPRHHTPHPSYPGPPMDHQQQGAAPFLPMDLPPPYQEPNAAELERLRLSGRSGPPPPPAPPAPLTPTANPAGGEKKPKKKKKAPAAPATGAPKGGGDEKEKGDSQKAPIPASSALSQTLTCEICEDRLDDPVTTPCEHLFCRECIEEWLAFNPTCPVDGKAVSQKSVKQAPLVVRNLLKLE